MYGMTLKKWWCDPFKLSSHVENVKKKPLGPNEKNFANQNVELLRRVPLELLRSARRATADLQQDTQDHSHVENESCNEVVILKDASRK